MRRLPLLALLAVLAGSFAFHAYRAEHPTTSYQSADGAYGKLAVGIADHQTYGNGLKDALHWPPGSPGAVRGRARGGPERGERGDLRHPRRLLAAGADLDRHGAGGVHDRRAARGRLGRRGRGGIVAFYPPLILATGEQLTEPFGAFWVTVAFALFVVAARFGRASLFAAGGLALGAAVLTRADLLPVPFVLAPLVAVWTWRAAGDLKRGAFIGGCILVGALAAMAPWSVYASQRAGEFVPVTRGSSSALFVGTYLPGNGTTVGMKRSLGAAKRRNPKLRGTADFDLEARSVLAVIADRHPDLEPNSAIALEARRNLSRYVREDPVGYGRMMLNKVQRMWSRYARGGARHTTWTIRGPHIALVLLAAAGLLLGVLRQRSLLLACILAAALTSTAVHMLVVSQARYNLPLMPALLAGGLAGWVMFVRGQRRRTPAKGPAPAATAVPSSRKPGVKLPMGAGSG